MIITLGLAFSNAGKAAEGASALQARAVLPPDVSNRVTAIIGCEGRPVPERWRFIVWDPAAENGFREIVVSDGKIVSKNLFSQFADRVRPEEVLPPETILVDSDKVAWLALMYASTNNQLVSSLHLSLRKPPELAAPVWRVDCFDGTQQQVGSISVGASEGKVLAHLGFPIDPSPTVLAAVSGVEGAKPKPSSKPRTGKSKSSSRPEAVAERGRPGAGRATPAGERPSGLSRVFRSIFRSND